MHIDVNGGDDKIRTISIMRWNDDMWIFHKNRPFAATFWVAIWKVLHSLATPLIKYFSIICLCRTLILPPSLPLVCIFNFNSISSWRLYINFYYTHKHSHWNVSLRLRHRLAERFEVSIAVLVQWEKQNGFWCEAMTLPWSVYSLEYHKEDFI